nr:hypothetical protein [Hymenobacter persicinus]
MPLQVSPFTNWQSISSGGHPFYNHTMAIRSDGTLWAWGANNFGQLGIGTAVTQQFRPMQVGILSLWKSVSTGYNHTMAVRTDGTLWAWGNNGNGQLGIGSTTQQASPVQVGTEADWQSVSAGQFFTVALRTNGTLWVWGSNIFGQLGLGPGFDSTQPTSPVQVGRSTWKSASAGYNHIVALGTDGTLWTWGANSSGQLGIGSLTRQTTPVQVGSGTNWQSISAGQYYTLALRTDGTLWAWGDNSFGQLGVTSINRKTSPTQVGTATTWQSFSTGRSHSVGMRTDGTLWAWGANSSGQLGNGSTIQQYSPVQVGSDTNWQSASPGEKHTAALRADGTLWAWGYDDESQLSIPSFSAEPLLLLSSTNAPLPVELVRFTATAAGAGTVQLRWTTAQESNNAGFAVERSSDGIHFDAIGWVDGSGTSSHGHEYSFRDTQLPQGALTLYYHLVQHDQDGTNATSQVRIVVPRQVSGLHLEVWPTRFSAEGVQLYIQAGQYGLATVHLLDAIGRVCCQREVMLDGSVTLALPEMAALPAGVYLLRVQQGRYHVITKLVRE